MSKIVTLTGAFKNAGDYLIGDRARTLLRNHTDAEIIDLNRREITDESYRLFNSARAVLLTGGPAYQEKVYPNVYDLDLSRIEVPVLAFGLGWKGKLGQEPEDFRFATEAGEFVRAIHADQRFFSSARDHLTVRMLAANGVSNVRMTGCPAWYDESRLAQDYVFDANPKRVVLSMPAVPQAQVPELIAKLAKDFPKAQRFMSFQAGFRSTHSKKSAEYSRWNQKMRVLGALRGFKSVSFEADFDGFQNFMSSIDFHVGYRVHSHIFSVSQRKTSLLIAEDSRGIGQVTAMGGVALSAHDPFATVAAGIDELFDTRGQTIQAAVQTMRATHGTMLDFVKQL